MLDKEKFSEQKRAVRQNFSLKALQIVQGFLRRMPRWCLIPIFYPLFHIIYFFAKRLRKIARQNFKKVYGKTRTPEEIESMIKQNLFQIGYCMFDLLYFVDRPQKLMQQMEIHGEPHLKKALAKNRGVIALTAHLNNFPLLFVALVQKEYPVNVMIRTMRDPQFSEYMFDLCAKWKIHMLATSPLKKLLSDCYSALRKNELLFILADEVADKGSGVKIQFFHHTLERAGGILHFQKKYQSPIVPIFITQDEKKIFHIHIEPELQLAENMPPEENERENMQRVTSIIERYVRKYPLQWGGWFNKKWSKS